MLDTEPELDRKLRALYNHIKTQDPPASLALFTVPSVRSRHQVLSRLVAIAAVAALAAAIGLFAIELNGHRGSISPRPTTQPASTPSPKSTPAPTFSTGIAPLTAGTHAALVLASGTYPEYTVVVPKGWFEQDGHFIITGATTPVLGFSIWDVGVVYRDPCHWQGQAFDPGPSVANLVAALVAQKMRNATTPTDVTLAGYAGKYLEWSVPADMKSSAWSEFDACDVDATGNHNFNSWLTVAAWATAMRRSRARSTSCGSSTSTGSDWSLMPHTHPTPPKVSGRHWSKSSSHSGSVPGCRRDRGLRAPFLPKCQRGDSGPQRLLLLIH